jgi:hypothetical protein
MAVKTTPLAALTGHSTVTFDDWHRIPSSFCAARIAPGC